MIVEINRKEVSSESKKCKVKYLSVKNSCITVEKKPNHQNHKYKKKKNYAR